MRLLEYCTPAWPAEDLQAQVMSLRQAFSADTNRPFELKPGFPYGSPTPQLSHTPPAEISYERPNITSHPSQDQMNFHPAPMTPPISAGHDDSKDGSIAGGASMTMMAAGRPSSMHGSQMGDEGTSWNPTPIFEYAENSPTTNTNMEEEIADVARSQWNNAFGTPPPNTMPSTNSTVPQAPYSPTASTVSHDLPQVPDALQHQQQQQFSVTSNMNSTPQIKNRPNPYSPPTSNPSGYVTPTMWQDTVANAYVQNDLKRRWDGAGGPAWMGSHDQQQVKHPR